MTLDIAFFNPWAVLAGFVSNMIIGALWYSPVLFGNVWLKLIGKKQDDISRQDASKSMILSIIPAVTMALSLALIIGIVGTTTIPGGLAVASLISVGFVGTSALNLVFFENRSLALTCLNVGYTFVSMNIAAIILVLWH